ncbi:hypothetical protein [Litchfieldia alkalitelluris]|uniref:hypothetical protein n=1 Tax=Litchfieldia alkalitelluris TaxID=304268 RepID=UPI0009983786|nr:hypothetical protein [Litchfieldia alkalitelluris]
MTLGNTGKSAILQMLIKLPPNYPVGMVFLNGEEVPVFLFSNVNPETGIAYFIDEEGQTLMMDVSSIDGIAFGDTEDEEC